MKKLLAIVLVFLMGFSHADVILDNHHAVTHKLIINNLDDYSDYSFFLVITSPSGDKMVAQINSAELQNWYKFSSVTIYAVKKTDLKYKSSENDMPLPYTVEDLQNANATIVDENLMRIDSLPDSSPFDTIETKYKMKLDGGVFSLEKVSDNYYPIPAPRPEPFPQFNYYLLVPVAGLIILGAWLILRKR